MLFTVQLLQGSAPESQALGIKFVTEVVVQVTTRRETLGELIRLVPRHPYSALVILRGLSNLSSSPVKVLN